MIQVTTIDQSLYWNYWADTDTILIYRVDIEYDRDDHNNIIIDHSIEDNLLLLSLKQGRVHDIGHNNITIDHALWLIIHYIQSSSLMIVVSAIVLYELEWIVTKYQANNSIRE